MKQYEATIHIPTDVAVEINRFLNAEAEDDFQGEDNTISYTAVFPDGRQMDIKCCGCQDEPSWTECVLFNECGAELCCSNVCEEFFGRWELVYEEVLYIVNVEEVSMSTWQIGDRVICTVDHPEGNKGIIAGMSGYVCCFNEWRAEMGYSSVGVCWDENIGNGHTCDNNCEFGHGWYMHESHIVAEPMLDFDVATDDELISFLGIMPAGGE